ncbi:MAG: hypothetical protein Q9174_005861, partial [Haloplaca sp. 1 TL-2023]
LHSFDYPPLVFGMASILDLPNELLCEIGNFLLPLDIEAFALASKRCYSGIKPVLDDHLSLKKQYSVLQYGILLEDSGMNTSLFFSTAGSVPVIQHIAAVIENPALALYPKAIRLTHCDVFGSGSRYASDNEEFRQIRESIMLKHQTKLKEIYLENDFLVADLWEASSDAFCGPSHGIHAVMMMLTLLPNLVSLSLDGWGLQYACWVESVYCAALRNRGLHLMQREQFLTQLRNLTVTGGDSPYHPRCASDGGDLQDIAAFAMLPSIRTLRASHLRGMEDFEWFSTESQAKFLDCIAAPFEDSSSTLTDVHLTASEIRIQAFREFLSGISALKRFTYHHCLTQWTTYIPYQPMQLIDLLRRFAHQSLEELDIERTDCHEQHECVAHASSKSLRVFSVLRKIRLEDSVFGRIGAVHDDASFDRPQSCEECGTRIVWEKLPAGLTLAEALPSSIEHVTLVQKMNDANTSMLLNGLAEEERLPNLRDVIVETPQGELEVRFKFGQPDVESVDQ